jgi:hypothetical protein
MSAEENQAKQGSLSRHVRQVIIADPNMVSIKRDLLFFLSLSLSLSFSQFYDVVV